MSNQNEKIRLEEIGIRSSYAAGVNSFVTRFGYEGLKHYIHGQVLELGPAEGIMTEELVSDGYSPVLVEGSLTLANSLSKKFPSLKIVNELFETFETDEKFDCIIMGHVLEHVLNPLNILEKYSGMLREGGLIWASVPNADSIHRKAAVIMGILEDVHELNEADIRHGHRRVFSPNEFRSIFIGSGMKILEFGGYWLKPLSNSQIESTWTEEMIRAFCSLGKQFPDISGEMYIIATKS